MSAYTDFLADPNRFNIWAAELYPYDSGSEAEVTLRVSTGEFATEPTETPHVQFDARLLEGPNFETDAAPAGTLGQLPYLRGGELRVGQRFGDIDTWRSYDFDGRRAVIRHGGYSPKLGRKLLYSEMGVSEYEMECLKPGLDFMTIPLRDPARRFEDPLQTRRYMGTDFSLELNGGTYVSFGAPAALNITGTMTWEGRIFIDSFPFVQLIHTWFSTDVVLAPWSFTIGTTGKLRFFASNYAAAIETTYTITAQRWYHVQIIRVGTAITFRILEESTGLETIETGTASAATGDSATGSLVLSRATAYVTGIFDEFRVWNTARTIDEWRDTRGRELTATEASSSSLKGYWRFNDATGTSVADSSGTAATGTITGAGSTWLPSLQGKAALAGQILPDAFGYVEDANPILVYEATRIYQVHSRNSSGSFTVSEGGATITAGTSYTDWRAFLTAATTAAQYDVLNCTDGTYVRLGSSPSKPISVTFSGDATGAGYVSTAADIVRRIITTRGKDPLTDPDDLNTTSYSALNTANSAVIGLYITEEIDIREAIRRVLTSVGAVGWFARADRKHNVKRFAGATGSSVVTLTEKQIISIEPLEVAQPVYEEVILYRHNYSVMTVDQMAAGTITTARQAFLEKAVRRIERRSSATKTRHKYARKEETDTYLTTEAAAILEADRRLALNSQEPQAYRIECSLVGLQVDRMDIITLTVKDLSATGAEQTRLGLSALDFVVLGIGERSAEGKAVLTIWRETRDYTPP